MMLIPLEPYVSGSINANSEDPNLSEHSQICPSFPGTNTKLSGIESSGTIDYIIEQ